MRWHISADLKRQVLRLVVVRKYKYKMIREILGISERTTKRICALHRWTGDVVKKRTVHGCPRLLNGFHISVIHSFCCNFWSCLMLDLVYWELRQMTAQHAIVRVAKSTRRYMWNSDLTCNNTLCTETARALTQIGRAHVWTPVTV